jgi:hypothetical protein
MNQTQEQFSRYCAAAKGASCQLRLQLCAILLTAAAVAAPASAAVGNANAKAAEAPKVNGGDSSSRADAKPGYTTYTNFSQVLQGSDARYPAITRVSDPGSSGHPAYTGFFFYQCLQFDATGRYLLGMRVHFDYRDIQSADRADVGFIDLKDQYKWTKSEKRQPGIGSRAPGFNGGPHPMRLYGTIAPTMARPSYAVCMTSTPANAVPCLGQFTTFHPTAARP